MAISRRHFLTQTLGGAVALAAAPALAACGGTQGAAGGENVAVKFGEPVSITFWHTQTGSNADALGELVSKFNATNGKNITLKSEYQGNYTQVFQKIMAAIQAGSPPDVAVAYESMVAEYMKANAVVDLDDYALKGPLALSKDDLNDIFPQYIESNKYDNFNGKLLSFPFTKSLAVHYTNDDMYKAAGITKYGQGANTANFWTFDEYKKAITAVTKKEGGKTTVYGTWIPVDTSYIDAFIFANGGELLNKDKTSVRFNEQPAVEIFDMWGTMAKNGELYTTPPGSYDWESDFGQQKVASLVTTSTTWSYLVPEIVDKATNKPRFTWSIGMYPQKDPKKPVTVMFGGNIAVFRTTPLKQAAAWEWIKFFTGKEQTVFWSIKSSYMPLRRSAAENADMKAFWQNNPQPKQAFDLTAYARPEPNIAAWQDIRDILQNALTAVLTGKQTAKAALDDAAKKANQLITEKRS